jgi:hypothetical protein
MGWRAYCGSVSLPAEKVRNNIRALLLNANLTRQFMKEPGNG